MLRSKSVQIFRVTKIFYCLQLIQQFSNTLTCTKIGFVCSNFRTGLVKRQSFQIFRVEKAFYLSE